MPTDWAFFTKQRILLLLLGGVVVAGALALFIWNLRADRTSEPEAVAQKAAEDSAKAENPFKSENVLVDVEADPFEKTKEVLNPFES